MRLLVDIGGTNARFGLNAGGDDPESVRTFKVSNFRCFEDALSEYLRSLPGPDARSLVDQVAIAAAGPLISDRITLTNASWTISETAIRSVIPSARVAILNDLEAVAMSLPFLTEDDVGIIATGGEPAERAPSLVVNLGTGFGAALAIPGPSGWFALPTEPGHMRLLPSGPSEQDIVGQAETVEDLFSGPGLQALRHRMEQTNRSPDTIRPIYSRILGRVVGDLMLATGAWGGTYFCGGVLSDFDSVIDRGSLVTGVRSRHGVAARLKLAPLLQIRRQTPAFVGLTHAPLR